MVVFYFESTNNVTFYKGDYEYPVGYLSPAEVGIHCEFIEATTYAAARYQFIRRIMEVDKDGVAFFDAMRMVAKGRKLSPITIDEYLEHVRIKYPEVDKAYLPDDCVAFRDRNNNLYSVSKSNIIKQESE